MHPAEAEVFRSTMQSDNCVALVSCRQHTVDGRWGTATAVPGGQEGTTQMADHPRFSGADAPEGRYLDGLNPAQREAVETLDGPLLVLAGAGTGKTRVLTTRLAHLLATGTARPWSILAVTFTNRAAREMNGRVTRLLGDEPPGIWLGTFHALGSRILRRHAELAGLQPNYIILDTDDQIRLLKQILAAEEIDEKRWPARALIHAIQRWKDRGLTPGAVTNEGTEGLAGGRLPEIYAQYQKRLEALNAVDFGDLLLHCLEIFKANPDVLGYYQDRFSHVLVDEYQDTNVAQYLWLRLLVQKRNNLCCVGDEDQSIYNWRGAEIGNILRFETHFPGATVIRLEQNYRSTSHVLAAASSLISNNRERLGKTLWTDGATGEKLIVHSVSDSDAEARTLADRITTRHGDGTPLAQMAILVRAGFQTRAFEEWFLRTGLPYRIVGGARFYERLEIRDAIAYLRVIRHPHDDLALERILNRPKRGLGPASLQALHAQAREDGHSVWAAIRTVVDQGTLRPQTTRALRSLLEDFERWQSLESTVSPASLAGTVLDESGYTGMWMAEKSPEAMGRLENLKELVDALNEFESLDAFLEHIGLVMDAAHDETQDRISLMTIHAAKGLEFDAVFLPGWEGTLFPHPRSIGTARGLEEERRLAYVALTRAREAVEISHAAARFAQGGWRPSHPSRFLDELPDGHVTRRGRTQRTHWPGHGMVAPSQQRGPGYRRRTAPVDPIRLNDMRRRSGGGVVIDGAGSQVWTAGDRVFHLKFGMGTVESVDGEKVEVAFDKAGRKMVVAQYISRP